MAAFIALESPGFKTFNLGTGKGTSVLEMVTAFRKASGHPIPTTDCPRRPGDVAWMWENVFIYFTEIYFYSTNILEVLIKNIVTIIENLKSVVRKRLKTILIGLQLPASIKCVLIYGAFNK